MSKPTLPKLLREVRKAVFRENYSQAETLYMAILELPEMAGDLDIKLRYALCAEKNGHTDRAIDAYSEVLNIYRQQEEHGAAASLELIIERLKKDPETLVPEPSEEDVEALDDATVMQHLSDMGELITLAPGEILCREGDMPDTLWLLRSGKITIDLPGYDEPDTITAKKGHLTLIGEIGIFTNQRRHAHIEAATTAELFAIKASDIDDRQESDPAFKAAMKRLLLERWAEPVLTRHAVFERVNDIDRMRIMHSFEQITLTPGKTLIEAGEEHGYSYMLQSGCMFFMHPKGELDDAIEADDGSMTTVFPGDMVHLGGLLKGTRSNYKVVTATPVRLLRLSQERFEPFTLRRPWIIQAIIQFTHRPAKLQVMKPDDDYLWKANRHIKTYLKTLGKY